MYKKIKIKRGGQSDSDRTFMLFSLSAHGNRIQLHKH